MGSSSSLSPLPLHIDLRIWWCSAIHDDKSFFKTFRGTERGGRNWIIRGFFWEKNEGKKERGDAVCICHRHTAINRHNSWFSLFLSFFLPLSYALVVSGWSLSGWTHLYTHTYIFIYFFSVRMTSSSRWWHYIQVNESPFRHQFQKRVYKIILDMKKKKFLIFGARTKRWKDSGGTWTETYISVDPELFPARYLNTHTHTHILAWVGVIQTCPISNKKKDSSIPFRPCCISSVYRKWHNRTRWALVKVVPCLSAITLYLT